VIKRIPLFILCLLFALPGPGAAAQSVATLQLPEVTVGLGQTTTADVILVCPASNCIGVDVTIAYDSDVIQIEEVTPGEFLGDAPRVSSSSVQHEGSIRFSALAAAAAGRAAEGVVFRIRLSGTAVGDSGLTVTSLSVFRRGGAIQASQEAGIVHVSDQVNSVDSTDTVELVTVRLTRRLTVRSGPGPEFGPVGTAEPNIDLEVAGISGDGAWVLVVLPNTLQGWLASSRFVTFSGSLDLIPVASMTIEAQPPTDMPAPTETTAPTNTEAPARTEVIPQATNTAAASPTLLLTNTPAATATQKPVEAATTEPATEPPTAVPSSTLVPPTTTLRTDSQVEIAPPASETAQATETAPALPSATPLPTETPLPTDTPEPPTPTFTATVPEPCTIMVTIAGIPVSVGPNRVVRTTLPINVTINVTGQQTAEDGSLWWRIEPLSGSVEADRFWVRQSDVTSQGDCAAVENADSPQVISGGSSGNQFASSFRSGQNSNSHTFSVATGGSYQIVCSGSPTYPEFSVGTTRSRGQTTIVLNLTPGTYTLTVFATTINRSGQTIFISAYDCRLSRN
jgi:hypothetical protein